MHKKSKMLPILTPPHAIAVILLKKAITKSKLLSVQKILSHSPAAANAQDYYGSTPLHLAVMKNNLSIVKKLLKIAPATAHVQDRAGYLPLHRAKPYKSCKDACITSHNAIITELLNSYPEGTQFQIKDSNAIGNLKELALEMEKEEKLLKEYNQQRKRTTKKNIQRPPDR